LVAEGVGGVGGGVSLVAGCWLARLFHGSRYHYTASASAAIITPRPHILGSEQQSLSCPALPACKVCLVARISVAGLAWPACLPHRSPARRETFPRPPLTIARTHRKGAPSVAHLTPAHQRPALEHPSEPSRALPCLACMHDRSSRATIPHRRRRTDGLTDC
jgi:hypothetical protein